MLRHAIPALLAGFLLLAGLAAAADNCEEIRSQIETKIRSAGVANPSVSVLQSDARHDGKVVGTCDAGRKKIVYQRLDAAAPAPSASPAQPGTGKPRGGGVITECKDGSVVRGGDCKKQ